MRTIAIVNEKGGTGKTTTAVSLSAALGEMGAKVLLVDLDGQAASSRWLGVEGDARLADALLAGGGLEPTDEVIPGVWLAPACGKLDSVAHDLRPTQGGQLRKVLSGLVGRYDYTLIDCPPGLNNRLIGNALLAASHAIVPTEPSILALDGVGMVLATLQDVRDGFNHDIALLGALVCRYEARTRLSRLVLQELTRALNGQVLKTVIRETIRMQECPASGKSILEYAPDSSAAADYRALAQELASWRWESPTAQDGSEHAHRDGGLDLRELRRKVGAVFQVATPKPAATPEAELSQPVEGVQQVADEKDLPDEQVSADRQWQPAQEPEPGPDAPRSDRLLGVSGSGRSVEDSPGPDVAEPVAVCVDAESSADGQPSAKEQSGWTKAPASQSQVGPAGGVPARQAKRKLMIAAMAAPVVLACATFLGWRLVAGSAAGPQSAWADQVASPVELVIDSGTGQVQPLDLPDAVSPPIQEGVLESPEEARPNQATQPAEPAPPQVQQPATIAPPAPGNAQSQPAPQIPQPAAGLAQEGPRGTAATESDDAAEPAGVTYIPCPPGYKLECVLKGPNGYLAIINGTICGVGQIIDGAKTVDILTGMVEMELNGNRFVLGIGQPASGQQEPDSQTVE